LEFLPSFKKLKASKGCNAQKNEDKNPTSKKIPGKSSLWTDRLGRLGLGISGSEFKVGLPALGDLGLERQDSQELDC
jgi:hypothetical protein